MPKRPELLAPVGSWESLLAAVNNGADAVYLGGKSFSARANANNFDYDEMTRAVEYCHLRGVKVYVTVNTLIADSEMDEFIDYLKFLYETGVDAAIIQDIGAARVAQEVLPGLELHASTQMTVYNLPGVELLTAKGFKRIVLAREVSLADMTEIKKKTGADLEVFIHGALCISYSGQCLMSSLIGGRSGNRGRCAQPCRLTYEMVGQDGKTLADPIQVGRHLLSPRDLNMLHHLPDLINAGIDSFKIEGRMKRPEYVATVIRVYREVIDRYLANPGNFTVSGEEDKALWQIFNRDFTTGYFYQRQGSDLMSYKRPNNRGLRLGRVNNFKSAENKVEIILEEPLHVGDGIEAWVTQGGRQGTVVRSIFKDGQKVTEANAGDKVWVELPGKIRTGDRVFKTNDALLMETAALSYTSAKSGQKVLLKCAVSGSEGTPLTITYTHPAGFIGQASTDFIAEKALKRPLTEETVFKQAERLGNTPFTINSVDLLIDGEIMVPVSEINEARRKAIENLERQIISSYLPEPVSNATYKQNKENALYPAQEKGNFHLPKLSVTVGDIASLKKTVEAGADVVYLSGDLFHSKKPYNTEELLSAVDFCHGRGVKLVMQTPRVAQNAELQLYLKTFGDAVFNADGILCSNLGFLKLYLDRPRTKIFADYTLNIYNAQSLYWLKEAGVVRATLSPELTMEQIRHITANAPIDVEYMVQGSLPMMISEYCAPGSVLGGLTSEKKCQMPCQKSVYGLKDRMGMVFPVETDRYCHMHIYNPKELCLIEEIGLLADAGVKYLRIEGKKDAPDYLAQVVSIYRRELDRYAIASDKFAADEALKEKLKNLSPSGVTKGHLYRGVI